jgi:DNA-binding MarR family transcriptional regulator
MTQLVDRLEAEGLVARVADPQDRRSIRAAITDEGRRRHAIGSKIVAEYEQMMLDGFGNQERSELETLIGHIGS